VTRDKTFQPYSAESRTHVLRGLLNRTGRTTLTGADLHSGYRSLLPYIHKIRTT
ncbi:hypothetical protein J6590_092573, partial [Homalodisca vitripennis]